MSLSSRNQHHLRQQCPGITDETSARDDHHEWYRRSEMPRCLQLSARYPCCMRVRPHMFAEIFCEIFGIAENHELMCQTVAIAPARSTTTRILQRCLSQLATGVAFRHSESDGDFGLREKPASRSISRSLDAHYGTFSSATDSSRNCSSSFSYRAATVGFAASQATAFSYHSSDA
jgi:hypothetical protein